MKTQAPVYLLHDSFLTCDELMLSELCLRDLEDVLYIGQVLVMLCEL